MTSGIADPKGRWFWPVAFVVGAVSLALFVAALSRIQIDRVDPQAGPDNLARLWPYWIGYAGLWAALTAVIWRLHKGEHAGSAGRERASAAVILFVAVVARLAVVWTTTPQLSDDVWRYIHDGRQVAQGVNPYLHAPAELAEQQPDDPILPRVNHPELVSIYLPTSQIVFGLLWKVHPPSLDPLGDITFRMGFAVIDVLIVLALLYFLRRADRSPWWAVAYAWHPLVISEVAGSGHQDVIGIVLLLGSFALAGPAGVSTLRFAAAGVAMAAAGLVKPIVVPLAIPLLWRYRSRPRCVVGGVSVGLVTGVLLCLPFLLDLGAAGRWLDTARAFAGTWSFNSSIHRPVAYLTGSTTWANAGVGLTLIVLLAVCMRRRGDPIRTGQLFLFVSLVLSSTVYPWYLLWALVFVPLFFDPAIWVFSLTIGWSYAVLGHATPWRLPIPLVIAEYLPVYAALAGFVLCERLGGTSRRCSAGSSLV